RTCLKTDSSRGQSKRNYLCRSIWRTPPLTAPDKGSPTGYSELRKRLKTASSGQPLKMTQSKSLKRTPRLVAAVAVALSLGILLGGVHSTRTQAASKHGGHAHNSKLAADLQQMLKDGSHDGRVRVIVQPAGAWSGG